MSQSYFSPEVVLLGSRPKTQVYIRSRHVERVLCRRLDEQRGEEYLVLWRKRSIPDPASAPASWHSVNELSRCLHLVQDYLNSCPKPSRKRINENRSPEVSDRRVAAKVRETSSPALSPAASASPSEPQPGSRDIKIFNGVLREIGGYIVAENSSNNDVVLFDATTLPTPDMVERATRTEATIAASRIRYEFTQRLRNISGPPIQLLNTFDESSPPLRFQFIDKCVIRDGVQRADPATLLGCTKCRPDMGQNIGCEYTLKCECLEYAAVDTARLSEEQRERYSLIQANGGEGDTSGMPKRFPYHSPFGNRAECLVPFYLESRHPIYECNVNCGCKGNCKTIVVQKGRQVRLQIFKTRDRGWGLKTLQDLKEGQFIDTYRGEIITDAEATRREEAATSRKDSYFYSLDKFADSQGLQPEDLYVIDGEYMGGPTRFMNHSCEPNCRQYTVSWNKNDFMIYEIAFFAIRPIRAGEELTFDYLDKDDIDESQSTSKSGQEKSSGDGGGAASTDASLKPVECRCGSKKCRKYLWI
ncbi:hypothetical protein BDY21DRAFT_297795 [Lineolata rhizophorae]|uniref:SET domain-containing protein n=1 Tax=Lineolata rhizophorae TaxID=578093 RepID=A0A6A6PAZ2_9PEZI|nr:hypothetical protein BDY21DRAFT_297795 [Lineolata rhizophorae]